GQVHVRCAAPSPRDRNAATADAYCRISVVAGVAFEDQITLGVAAGTCTKVELEQITARAGEITVLHGHVHCCAGALHLEKDAVVAGRVAQRAFGEIVKGDAVEAAAVNGVDYPEVV